MFLSLSQKTRKTLVVGLFSPHFLSERFIRQVSEMEYEVNLPQEDMVIEGEGATLEVVAQFWAGDTDTEDNSTEKVKEVIKNLHCFTGDGNPGFRINKNHLENTLLIDIKGSA